jgi:hypothetical protein
MLTFEVISGNIVISDPSYKIETTSWESGVVKARNGIWITDKLMVGNEIKEICAYNNDAAINDPGLISELFHAPPLPFINGVDSGQLVYFDGKYYRDDNSVNKPSTDESGDQWYRVVSNITNSKEQFGVLPNGVASITGYGDGAYVTQAIFDKDKLCIGLRTEFIKDKYLEDDDDWWNIDDDDPESEEEEEEKE